MAATAIPTSGASQQDRVQVNTDTFVYTGLGLSARTDASDTTHFVRCSCGLFNDERTPDAKKYSSLFDGPGSIVAMTDSSSNEVNRYDDDPSGQTITQQEQSGLNTPWKFAAGYLDSSTGLYKFGVRYYDPSLGRWTQQDPVGGSLAPSAGNRYTYANDDPVNVVDPSGELTCFQSILTALATIVGTAQIGEYLAAAALVAIGGPIGFLVGLLIAAGAIYVEILAGNQAFVDCGHPEYQFPLPF